MFSKEFQKRLESHTNTKWAVQLSEDNLEKLLWMVGEFGHGGCNLMEVIEKHMKEISQPRPYCERAYLALKGIKNISTGSFTDLDKIKKKISELGSPTA